MILGQYCFIIISDVDDGTECTLSMFAGCKKMGEMVDPPHGCVAIQRDVDKLEKWANGEPHEVQKGSTKSCNREETTSCIIQTEG